MVIVWRGGVTSYPYGPPYDNFFFEKNKVVKEIKFKLLFFTADCNRYRKKTAKNNKSSLQVTHQLLTEKTIWFL